MLLLLLLSTNLLFCLEAVEAFNKDVRITAVQCLPYNNEYECRKMYYVSLEQTCKVK